MRIRVLGKAQGPAPTGSAAQTSGVGRAGVASHRRFVLVKGVGAALGLAGAAQLVAPARPAAATYTAASGGDTVNTNLTVQGHLYLDRANSDGARLVWRGGTSGTQEYRARVGTDGTLSFFPAESQTPILALNLTQAGNVGVGTASPQARLHVAGDLRVDGALQATARDAYSAPRRVLRPVRGLRPVTGARVAGGRRQ